MKQENNNPRSLCSTSGGYGKTDAKVNNLPRIQRKVYDLLNTGGKYSVFDITTRLRLADPRGHIAALRRKGIEILDEWRTTTEGERYKVYFVGKGGQNV